MEQHYFFFIKEEKTKKKDMFSPQEKKYIHDAFSKFREAHTPQRLPKKLLLQASAGILVNAEQRHKLTKQALIDVLKKVDANDNPWVEDDSTSAWMHQAILQFGLTVGDIRAMKFGQTMRVLLMDRNVGEYVDESTYDFNPSEQGFSYATYIHGTNLTGLLKFDDVDVVHAPFEWELNLKAIDSRESYWGPLSNQTDNRIRDDMLVGWRGPSIDMIHMPELPDVIHIYENWWNDYGVNKYHNWSHRR